MKTLLALMLLAPGLTSAAGLEFIETLREIRPSPESKTVSADFKFTNTSDKPITITKYDGGCTCMSVKISEGKLQYAPGESGSIRADFELGNFSGTVDRIVGLWLAGDKPESPSVSLTVRVHIPVLVAMEPRTLTWELNGKGGKQTIDIRMTDEVPLKILNITGSSEAFTHELETVEEEKHYRLIIEPVDVTQPGLAIFRIETNSEIPRHRSQQAFAVVRKPVGKP